MGNTASTESNGGNGGNGAGPSAQNHNSLSRPRSHGGAVAASHRDSTDRAGSPSWSRHGSIKRESSQTPTQNHARNPFFRENTATPFSATALRRGRSGSASLPAPPAEQNSLAPGTTTSGRERSMTSDSSPTTAASSPQPAAKSSAGASTTLHGSGSTRRPSRFRRQKSIDLHDVDEDLKGLRIDQDGKPIAAAAITGTISPGSQALPPFAPFLSPCPSPSIAANPKHAAGANSYLAPDNSDKAAASRPSSSSSAAPNRAFGRGVAAIFSTAGQSLGSASMAAQGSADLPHSPQMKSSESGAEAPYTTQTTEGYPSTSSGPPIADEQGREISTALPSYLKIPTLIPSKQEPVPTSLASAPSSPTIGSGQATPASSGWSSVAGVAGKATNAVLTTEDVLIAPGDASRVSSPILEDRQFPGASPASKGLQVSVDGTGPTEITGADPTTPLAEPSEVSGDDTGSTALSRTPTPTQKSHAAKALTPARIERSAKERVETEADAAQQENLRKVHIATGLASGVTTPIMPIPPGLTPAPPSAHSPPSVRNNDAAAAAAAIAAGLGLSTPVTGTPARDDEPKTPTSSTTPKQRHPPAHLTPYYYKNAKEPISLMPIVVTWRGGGKEVFVTGTFANEWRSKILLKRAPVSSSSRRSAGGSKDEFSVVLHLPAGTHRMKFIVDDRWRVSRELPTASDGDGNLVNYLEIPNVGPAHSGPLSAPGEDLPDGSAVDRERERRREREVERIKEAGRAAAASKRRQGDASVSGTSLDSGLGPSAEGSNQSAEEGRALQREARLKAVMDLREEARKAELLRLGQLEEAFGIDDEALRAAETWAQEIPESVVKAQQAEEGYRDRLESQPPTSHSSKHDEGEMPPVPPPPSLPRQLEKVILNSSPANPALVPPGGLVDDNSVLPAPNHVVLNHLTASSIKGGVLAVGTTTRYKRKYVTTVFYRPVQA